MALLCINGRHLLTPSSYPGRDRRVEGIDGRPFSTAAYDGTQFMTMKKRNRVLAIDDEPSMIEWLKILLEHEGYEVRTAMIGTRGEEIFKTWKPDVVVTDMLLPDADGLELLRKFKQIHADTEVIVVTGHGS